MSKVIIEKNGPVRTVWMNRPDKKNALDSELLANMIDALKAPVAPDDRVVVIRGKGDVFCAGLDMRERSQSAGAGKARLARSLAEMLKLPDTAEKRSFVEAAFKTAARVSGDTAGRDDAASTTIT